MSEQQPMGKQPTLEDQYLEARDALIKLNGVRKDGNQKQVTYWCGVVSRRTAAYVKACLAPAIQDVGQIVIAKEGDIK